MALKTRKLGAGGPDVSEIGLGCMSFAGFYGPADEKESLRTLARANEMGITFFDTANVYGAGSNEELLCKFLKGRGERIVLATKGGIVRAPGSRERRLDNSPAYLVSALEDSLRRLGRDHVDLYYIHRRERGRPIEEAIEALAQCVKAGKIGGIGLSEMAPDTLRRAHAVNPIRAVQSQYSLGSRGPDLGLIGACKDLGVAFVAFGVLGRAFLTARLADPATIPDNDFRKANPRFVEPNFSRNREALARFEALARAKATTPAALAVAWVLAQGEHVIPIPGTRQAAHLEEDVAGAAVKLSADDLAAIERALPRGFAAGDRYTDAQYDGVERYG
jgi:aryl-alcohol dehydrogenase-like predicted oxidoreductase